MNIARNNKTGYLFYFYRKFVLVYIGMGRTFDWELRDKLHFKFDSVTVEEVPVEDMGRLKRSHVNRLMPVYNKREVSKKRSVTSMSLAEKLGYCKKEGISLGELNNK